ncbi:MAG TPA: TIGR03617 family F420-dependent LLM class oxidoreductase [Anaerolineales bacterium]|nr:TIGR03617 family F420-dependent LLM class oxidoreductase [Anaerolineales bacterium]
MLKLDAALAPALLQDVPGLAAAAEALGFDTVWTSETQHDPFLPLALVAEHTTTLGFGTAVAIGFARSPTVLAHTAWDLAAASGGRLRLGLGTQVRPHVERRFGLPWPASPSGAMREYIQALRAVWRTWQTGERLNYRGDVYRLTLMTPFFSPAPIGHPSIPIYLAGVNRGLIRLAGECADGLHVHPLHSARYLRETVQASLREGAEHAGRDPAAVDVSVSVFVVTETAEADFVRSQIAFYASTPSYRPVLELHGWSEVADRLSGLARHAAWADMPALIDEEMLRTFAVVAEAEALPQALNERYHGLANRLTLYQPFRPGERDAFWRHLAQGLAR